MTAKHWYAYTLVSLTISALLRCGAIDAAWAGDVAAAIWSGVTSLIAFLYPNTVEIVANARNPRADE